ncbi:MAG: hypothetical protein EOP53_24390 [Sphingobacteriales bacterium]|nr:MAG: hypothetical protein EOP53_24390 [Sphingobacteriales bacterium]
MFFKPTTTCARQKATSSRSLHFLLLARAQKEYALLAAAYYLKLPAIHFAKLATRDEPTNLFRKPARVKL